MISLSEAQDKIDKEIPALSAVDYPLPDAVGCALESDVIAAINVPEFRSSVMDGIAVRRTELGGSGPWKLRILGTIAAGDSPELELKPGCAFKIMTGAPLPNGTDLVIPIEDVSIESDFAVIDKLLNHEDYIRPVGDDISKGTALYRAGDILKPVDIGVLVSLGLTRIKVIPRPNIGIFSTGSEIVEPGEKLGPGQIYDSNNAVLRALLARDGHHIANEKKVIEDDPASISRNLEAALNNHDLLITTGGVSMGDFDFIPRQVKTLGGEIIFHKVSVKPGKPILLARFGRKYLVGLPGNPVSVIAGYHLFARRVISRLMGIAYAPRNAQACLGCDLAIDGDRFYLAGARLDESDGKVTAFTSARQKSGRLSSVAGIDGFVFADGGTRTIPKGSRVYCEWL